jgi:NADH:ubiquinone oxidoreductase subunit
MSYLNFKYEGTTPSGLTERWTVYNSVTEIPLGWISWRAGWRKYVFNTMADMSFDASCLDEISAFLKREMAKR